MPEIEIRPAVTTDIPVLVSLDHNYSSFFTWQMDVQREEGKIKVGFLEIQLPRSVRVEYPRSPSALADDWTRRHGLLVAVLGDETVAYISMMLNVTPLTTWVTDLAVMRRLRRQGIGSGLVLAAQEWGLQHDTKRIVLEVQPKNYPAIQLAQKLGFNFCGYNDRYYSKQDIALFFAKSLR
jgi:ribosomal protein S18 acetylase RimI-like enzyme